MINIVIHRVAEGETIYSISAEYGISAERIIQDNRLQNPDSLVVGQTIVILFPLETYTVAEGDTLEKISEKTGVPVLTLRRNNPVFNTGLFIYPGQTLVLEYTGRSLEISMFSAMPIPILRIIFLHRRCLFLHI